MSKKTSSRGKWKTEDAVRSEIERAMSVFEPHGDEFSSLFGDFVKKGATGWLRLNVRFERGRVKAIQIIPDNTYTIHYGVDERP